MAEWFKHKDGWLNLDWAASVVESNDPVTCDLEVRFTAKYRTIIIHDPADMARLRRRLDAAAGEQPQADQGSIPMTREAKKNPLGLILNVRMTRDQATKLQSIADRLTNGNRSAAVRCMIRNEVRLLAKESDGRSTEGD